MSLGKLFIVGLEGKTLLVSEQKFIKEQEIGGVILFTRNYENPQQLSELVASIQDLASDLPLFISVDHEGGRVLRFKKDFSQFPSMASLAALNSPKTIYDVHHWMGLELSTVGINLSFSPCCDVFLNKENQVIGDRSFGRTSEQVERFVSAAIRGLQSTGVLACAKHFPGHGATLEDSHFLLPMVERSLEQIKQEELPPFLKAARSKVDLIMMGHLLIKELDDQRPCTLSSKAYQWLRDELGYSRLIVTDDMEMQAITDYFPDGEAGYLALQAGADLLIYRSLHSAQQAYDYAYDKLSQKKLMIEDKISRVLACQSKLPNFSKPTLAHLQETIPCAKAQEFLQSLS